MSNTNQTSTVFVLMALMIGAISVSFIVQLREKEQMLLDQIELNSKSVCNLNDRVETLFRGPKEIDIDTLRVREKIVFERGDFRLSVQSTESGGSLWMQSGDSNALIESNSNGFSGLSFFGNGDTAPTTIGSMSGNTILQGVSGGGRNSSRSYIGKTQVRLSEKLVTGQSRKDFTGLGRDEDGRTVTTTIEPINNENDKGQEGRDPGHGFSGSNDPNAGDR